MDKLREKLDEIYTTRLSYPKIIEMVYVELREASEAGYRYSDICEVLSEKRPISKSILTQIIYRMRRSSKVESGHGKPTEVNDGGVSSVYDLIK